MAEDSLSVRPVERTYLLDDLTIRSDGSGRIVEAYAAVFGQRAEVRDQDGHYHEENAPTSFNRTIAHKGPTGFGVLFNHGRTVDGASYPAASMPIGVPLEVTADEKGVFTATRYLNNPLADDTLDAIKKGALRAQSYSGRFMKSSRARATGGGLPIIRRDEIDMREYGPAVFAAYGGAQILGTRADTFVRSLLATKPEDRLRWLEQFEISTQNSGSDDLVIGTLDGLAEGVPGDSLPHSTRPSVPLAAYLKRERIRRSM